MQNFFIYILVRNPLHRIGLKGLLLKGPCVLGCRGLLFMLSINMRANALPVGIHNKCLFMRKYFSIDVFLYIDGESIDVSVIESSVIF